MPKPKLERTSSSSHSRYSLLHEHDPTMDSRIVHAVNVSNKKEISQLKHKAKSLEGSRDVSMHIYRQEEKELVKHLFKLQQEKQRRHPEIDSTRRHHHHHHDHVHDVPNEEFLIKSLDFHHGGSSTHQKPANGSNASLLDQYIKEPIYQPVGYGHASQEYVGVPQDITEKQHSSPDGRFKGNHTTSQTALSHPAIANALPSRHQINVGAHLERHTSSKTMAFLEPESQLKKGSLTVIDRQQSQEGQVSGGDPKLGDVQTDQVGSRESLKQSGEMTGAQKATNVPVGVKDSLGAHPKRKVMFDVASSANSSPVNQTPPPQPVTSEHSDIGSGLMAAARAHPPTMTQTSSMECLYDEPYESEMEKRESITKARIDQEHHRVDSMMDAFRKAFPVKQEQSWQKTHPRRGPERGPFVAHTPAHQVTSQDWSVGSDTNRIHRHDSHGASTSSVEHIGTRLGHGRQSGSHANVSHRQSHGSPRGTPHGSYANVSRSRQSHSNVTHESHAAKIDSHSSSGSQNTVGSSIYNLPKEALDDYRNLMQKASHAAHHPNARDSHNIILPHHKHADIPHSHPPKAQTRKARQKLLALHLLANQKRQNKEIPVAKIDPQETLMCRYLRLSTLNVDTLVDMCNEAGVVIGIHPHMSIDDVAKYVFDENLLGNETHETSNDIRKVDSNRQEQVVESKANVTESAQSTQDI